MAIVKNCFARVNGYCKQSICVDEQSEFVEALLRFTSEFGSFKFPAIFANDHRNQNQCYIQIYPSTFTLWRSAPRAIKARADPSAL